MCTCISIYIYTYPYIYLCVYSFTYSVYTHHLSSNPPKSPLTHLPNNTMADLHGRRDVFHQAPSPQDRQNHRGHADHPGLWVYPEIIHEKNHI